MTTTYAYDLHGNLISVTDAGGHQTTYQYDDMGRIVSINSPDTGTVTYVYDEAGNLIFKTDEKGITIEHLYDSLSRLTQIQFPDSAQDITFSYDSGVYGKGFRTGMTDPSGTTTFNYDNRGRLIEKTSTIDSQNYPISRTYTLGSRISSITYPSGRTVDYSRSGCKCRIDGVSTTYNDVTTTLLSNLTYLPFGPAAGIDMGNGTAIGNVYDESYRLFGANPGASKEYIHGYDANGNLTDIFWTNYQSKDHTFSYDDLNRLKGATGPYGIINYTYDSVGNRLTRTIDAETETYSYVPGTNKLSEITGPNAKTFSYDVNCKGQANYY